MNWIIENVLIIFLHSLQIRAMERMLVVAMVIIVEMVMEVVLICIYWKNVITMTLYAIKMNDYQHLILLILISIHSILVIVSIVITMVITT